MAFYYSKTPELASQLCILITTSCVANQVLVVYSSMSAIRAIIIWHHVCIQLQLRNYSQPYTVATYVATLSYNYTDFLNSFIMYLVNLNFFPYFTSHYTQVSSYLEKTFISWLATYLLSEYCAYMNFNVINYVAIQLQCNQTT